ncbi:MAG: tripartite tricarboxylate transporter TctB family protein [Sphaerochaeta sp.]|jgi:putative tricarboxylic transport membrane protein|nr:tripartite tricarboxylate transporter TctB family protein [Sphaerochaeta sp.]MCH3918918.1 tripartite tricarboxylate transporter TctB family protein [Sphaerochaeta sp.]MCI2077105.1 tripartite tricarboxylate transporter TctB family protein [Sphaerochaeta sp.]
MRKANIIVSILIAAIAITIIVISAGYPRTEAYGTGAPGPGLWPISVSVVLLAMAVIVFVKTIRGKMDYEDPDHTFTLASLNHLRVYLSMAVLVVYVALLKPLGFLLPTFVMVAFFTYWFSKEQDASYVAKKPKNAFGKMMYQIFDITDGMRQSRPLWKCLLVSAISTLIVYYVFKLGLNVPMDFGLLYI